MTSVKYSYAIILLLPVIINARLQKALFFDGVTHSLFDIPNQNSLKDIHGAGMTACPAELDEEKQFNDKYSLTKKALFAQTSYADEILKIEYDRNVCIQGFETSIIVNFKDVYFEFGYEIYFDRNIFPGFKASVYEEYRSFEFILDAWVSLRNMLNFTFIELKKFFRKEKKQLWLNEIKQLDLIWIFLFKIKFDNRQKILKKVVYEIHKHDKSAGQLCENYSLGKEIYRNVDVDSLYLQINQIKIFSDKKLPAYTSEASCKLGMGYICLKKWLLIPANQFEFGYSKLPVCSNMATIPIWQSTVEGVIQKLDQYLLAIARVSGETLHIVSGIKGTLHLPKYSTTIDELKPIHVDLENNRIPAPNIIYKIVKYKLKDCRIDKPPCWFAAVVVIHNDPYFKENDKVCPFDLSGEWGWEEIRYELSLTEGPLSRYIYLCKNDQVTIQNLELTYNEDLITEELKLWEFPYYDKDKKVASRNIKGDVLDELKKIRQNEKDLIIRNNEIIEKPQDEADFDAVNDSKTKETDDVTELSQDDERIQLLKDYD